MAADWGRLHEKVWVITGAASTIAEAVANRLTHEGGTVVGVDRREHGIGTISLLADLADEDQVQNVFARIKTEIGRIDALYNNIGLNDPEDFSALNMPLEVWERVLTANLTTTFLCCKHAIPYLLDNKPPGGSVINTTSFCRSWELPAHRWPIPQPRPVSFSSHATLVSTSPDAAYV